jgi:tetratricopeptide (TPR) repeat protein
MAPRPFRIFISSPSDVRPERLIAQRVVDRLAREFAYHFTLEAVMWEREPLVATEHFQTMITRPSATDVVVVVLWSRLGTPLPRAEFPGPMSGGPVTGTEWEFEEAVKSYRENHNPALLLYRKKAGISGSLDDEAELQRQLQQKKLVESFIARWFGASGGPALAAMHDFERADEFEERLETHLRELIRSKIGADDEERRHLIRWHAGSPWRGLSTFEPEHAQVFFGRNRARADLRMQLTRRAEPGNATFILVTGASGTGKSSLVKAGLIPDVKLPGMIPNIGLVRIAMMRPNDVEDDPMAALARALVAPGALPELLDIGFDAERIERMLKQMPDELPVTVGTALMKAGERAELLQGVQARLFLMIDQFEEIYLNPRISTEVRAAFVHALGELARWFSVWVVATLRSDVYNRLDETPEIAELLRGKDGQDGIFRLAPPTDAELAEIVRRPAEEAGLSFEIRESDGARLEDVIVHAAARQPNALPLLSFTLDELWQTRTDSGKLTFAKYEELGGLSGAIAHRADDTLAALDDGVRAAFPRVLRALVSVGEGDDAPIAAQPAPLNSFEPESAARRLVDAFIAARLFVIAGEGDEPLVRLAHEALISDWELARKQLAADRRNIETRALVERQRARWATATGRQRRQLLLRDLDLAAARDLAGRWGDELDPGLVTFIKTSLNHSRRRQRLVTAAAIVFALIANIATVAGFFAYRAEQRAIGNYAVAKEAVDSLIFDIANGLRDVEGLRVGTIALVLDTVRKNIDRLATANPDDPALERSREVMFNNFVETYLSAGDLSRSHEAATESLAIATRLAQRAPKDAARQRDLSIAYENAGDVLSARGNLDEGLDRYRASLAIRERLAAGAPENLIWQRDLSISHEKVADVLAAKGDFAGALESYRADLDIMTRLTGSNPDNRTWQRDLSVSYGRIGGILSAQNDLAGALSASQSGLAITQRLAQQDPTNAAWQRDLSVAHGKVGDILSAQRDAAGALTEYRTSLEIARRLARQDPDNALWQRNLFVSLTQVGLRVPANEAAPIFGQALAVATSLAKAHPENRQTANDLAWITARCRASKCTSP